MLKILRKELLYACFVIFFIKFILLAYLMNALLSKSPDGSTLSGMNIAVFDLHSRRFAERLLNAGVSSLSIIETSQYEAQKAKVRFLFWF